MPNGNLNEGIQSLKKQLSSGKDESASGVMQMVQFIAQQQQILLGHFGTLQQQVENSQQSIKGLIGQLEASKSDTKAANDVVKQLSRIEKDLGSVPRVFPEQKDVKVPDNAKQLVKLEEMMARLPTELPKDNDALMGEIRDSLLMLFEKPLPESVKSDIIALNERMDQKKEFVFDVDRDNEGFIDKVIVRQV